ncbi:MAG: hypothetical protein LBV52_04165, partial [Spirochaetaceae bacterium]|nr:hypothetical protein [Spirochaetaceae bacterium]
MFYKKIFGFSLIIVCGVLTIVLAYFVLRYSEFSGKPVEIAKISLQDDLKTDFFLGKIKIKNNFPVTPDLKTSSLDYEIRAVTLSNYIPLAGGNTYIIPVYVSLMGDLRVRLFNLSKAEKDFQDMLQYGMSGLFSVKVYADIIPAQNPNSLN